MWTAAAFYILQIALWATGLLWLAAIFWTRREIKALPPLAASQLLPQKKVPRVSVLLPARNEENRILQECVASLLAQTYQNYEIIAVNDRSTDRTGEILREMARGDSRLKIIEGAELPAGWLGKPFVMQQAFSVSDGEWILTTDADIVFAPDAIQTAIAHVEKHNFDALCLIPFDICASFTEQIFLPVFSWFRMLAMPPTRVNDFARPETMGIGNFFLVRRAWLEKINGFDKVKTEVAEDLKLARLLKKTGARFRLDYAPDLLETRMYSGFWEIWHGFSKNFFAGLNFSPANAIASALANLLFGVLPFFGSVFSLFALIFSGDNRWLWFFTPLGLIYFFQTVNFALLQHSRQQKLIYAFFAPPLGIALFTLILINSMILILSGRGVRWKGRAIYKKDDAVAQTHILENK